MSRNTSEKRGALIRAFGQTILGRLKLCYISIFWETLFSGTENKQVLSQKEKSGTWCEKENAWQILWELDVVLTFGGLIRFTEEYFSNEPHLKHDDGVLHLFQRLNSQVRMPALKSWPRFWESFPSGTRPRSVTRKHSRTSSIRSLQFELRLV